MTTYDYNDVINCIDAAEQVGQSTQTVFNSLYHTNRLDEIIKACNEYRRELGTGKELNRKLSIIRVQVKRTCKVHDVPTIGIKWDKDTNSFKFVNVDKARGKPKDKFMQAVAKFKGWANDDDKKLVMELMATIEKNREH